MLADLPFRLQVVLLRFVDPRFRIGLRVVDRYSDLQSLSVDPAVSFSEMHHVAVRIAIEIQPWYVVEPDGVDDERVPFPSANRVAHPRWIRIVRKLSSVGPDRAPMPVVLEEHDDAVRDLDDLKRLRNTQQFRYAVGIASQDWIIFFAGNYS